MHVWLNLKKVEPVLSDSAGTFRWFQRANSYKYILECGTPEQSWLSSKDGADQQLGQGLTRAVNAVDQIWVQAFLLHAA